ncbi:helix-turn-helix domain-containing protein [Tsukamurella tyrosinosolvens]|nr:helix-turn-helix transcriptional regulator [Tsukamurella tyrosinosolvens]
MGEEDAIDKNFGTNMKRTREALGLSKADLLRWLEGLGWENAHQTTITRIEDGDRAPRLGEAKLIAKALMQPLDSLMAKPEAASLAAAIVQQYQATYAAATRTVEASESFDSALARLSDLMKELDAEAQELIDDETIETLRYVTDGYCDASAFVEQGDIL